MAQLIKQLPAMQETQFQSLGHENTLEKGMATHFSILAWRIPRTEQPGRIQSMGSQELDMTEQLTLSLFKGCLGCQIREWSCTSGGSSNLGDHLALLVALISLSDMYSEKFSHMSMVEHDKGS